MAGKGAHCAVDDAEGVGGGGDVHDARRCGALEAVEQLHCEEEVADVVHLPWQTVDAKMMAGGSAGAARRCGGEDRWKNRRISCLYRYAGLVMKLEAVLGKLVRVVADAAIIHQDMKRSSGRLELSCKAPH